MNTLITLISFIIVVKSQYCNDKQFHLNNDTMSVVCINDLGDVDIKGSLSLIGNITTNGYCNCKMDLPPVMSFNYSSGNYIPKIGDGINFYNTNLSKGYYNIYDKYLTLDIYIIWSNTTSSDPSIMNNNIIITLPIPTDNSLPYYSGTIGYLKGMTYSYEISVLTSSNILNIYTLLSNGNNKNIKIKDTEKSGEIGIHISYYIF